MNFYTVDLFYLLTNYVNGIITLLTHYVNRFIEKI